MADTQSHPLRSEKAELGQFYTRAYDRILDGFGIPPAGTKIIEPFAGAGHLVAWARGKGHRDIIEAYDIAPAAPVVDGLRILQRDTLRNPPVYQGRWILTNPPYLAKNKTKSYAELFARHGTNDLYKVFLSTVIGSGALGGLLILPLNFWCSVRAGDTDLRRRFLEGFVVDRVHVFEERVFEDTGYTVCAFSFTQRPEDDRGKPHPPIMMRCFPTGRGIEWIPNDQNAYRIGGELWGLEIGAYRVGRLREAGRPSTRLNLYAIDGGRSDSMIRLTFGEPPIFGKDTDRARATITIEPIVSEARQQWLVGAFQARINELRDRYNSLFLVQYREGTRKRIPFDLAYRLIANLLHAEGEEEGLADGIASMTLG